MLNYGCTPCNQVAWGGCKRSNLLKYLIFMKKKKKEGVRLYTYYLLSIYKKYYIMTQCVTMRKKPFYRYAC